MAEGRRGKKRKSEDFIYEVNDNDLSSDEEENASKKRNSEIDAKVEVMETENNPSSDDEDKTNKETIVLDTEESNQMDTNQNSVDENSATEDVAVGHIPEKNSPEETNNEDVILIDNSNTNLSESCIIIEDPIPIMVLSDDDDDVEEEGEIIEDFKIVDEVTSTLIQNAPITETPKKDNSNKVVCIGDTEFQVVEEIGPSPMPTEKKTLMNISFSCDKAMNQYGHLLVRFLKSFPEVEIAKSKLCITVNEKEKFEDTVTPKKKHGKKKKAKKDLFVLDPNPSSNDDNLQFFQFRYTSKFELTEEGEPEKDDTKAVPSRICFNCDGNHALKDCDIPKNFSRISKARFDFLQKHKTVRYHADQNPKFANFKPGVISDNLREALGLRKNELPGHIYRMRNLGYPPGWLEEAKVLPSNLSLFDIDGEKIESRKTNKTSIDPSKIVDYHGFNMPINKGCFDDFKRHNVKPYNKWMHKSNMIEYLEEKCGNDIDMDDCEVQDIKKKTKEQKLKDSVAAPVSSPSLVDLEEKKKELMDELNSSQEQAKSSVNDSEGDTSQETPEETEKNEIISVVKNTQLGTPILSSSSPYARLPNPDNFSVGVSPVIDFENLPNSTGKYEELSKVLNKVRTTMKNI